MERKQEGRRKARRRKEERASKKEDELRRTMPHAVAGVFILEQAVPH
jgi:hypothetical protein